MVPLEELIGSGSIFARLVKAEERARSQICKADVVGQGEQCIELTLCGGYAVELLVQPVGELGSVGIESGFGLRERPNQSEVDLGAGMSPSDGGNVMAGRE